MITALDVSHLHHAYGRATDTEKLLGLFGDEEAREAASYYLNSAILHQGTAWPSTVPIVDVLVECLRLPEAASARVTIIDFVADVAEAAQVVTRRAELDAHLSATASDAAHHVVDSDAEEEEEDWSECELGHYLDAVAAIVGSRERWAQAILPFVEDPDPRLALAAREAVAMCDDNERASRATRPPSGAGPADGAPSAVPQP